MICPHCNQDINDTLIAKHLASKGGKEGGKKSRRTLTRAQSLAMIAARKAKREAGDDIRSNG